MALDFAGFAEGAERLADVEFAVASDGYSGVRTVLSAAAGRNENPAKLTGLAVVAKNLRLRQAETTDQQVTAEQCAIFQGFQHWS